LVAFKPEIRDSILVDDVQKRGYFTKLQCELDYGHPLKPEQQDTIEEVMTLSDGEVEFWIRVDRDPYMLYVEDSIKHVDQYWVDLNRKLIIDRKAEKIREVEEAEYDSLLAEGQEAEDDTQIIK